MGSIQVGCVPMTWGQFREKAPDQWPEERVMGEIAQAGYAGVAGATQKAELLNRFGLKPAPGYLSGVWWKKDQHAGIIESAKRQAAAHRAVGLTELFVAAKGNDQPTARGKTRAQIAGQVTPTDSLTDDEYKLFADALNEVGRATLKEGVRICFHNHAATFIETRQECDTLFALCDPAAVFLGPDTGHLAWGGADPVAFFRDYAPRIKSVHVKDINPTVLARGRQEKWNTGQFVRAGIFTELGTGCVDFPALLSILRSVDYTGWILSEQDWTMKSSPLETETINRQYLKRMGI